MVALCSVFLLSAAGCADEDFTQDVQARWCELVGADCAPPPPLTPPVLNQPEGGAPAPGPAYVIPRILTPAPVVPDTDR